jgi:tetratricopeptide (TPR) repeat protein
MPKPAWYAKKTWSAADREGFLARLRTVAGANEQAAALRKQAGHLLQASLAAPDGDQLLAGARELHELFLDQFPDSAERAYVLCALGGILERAGEHEAAFARWREALAAQRGTPRSTNAHLRFGLLALRLGRRDLFPEVVAQLAEFGQVLVYPIDQYQQCGIKAHLNAHAGRRDRAVLCARDALSAAAHVAVDAGSDFHRLLLDLTSATPAQ